MKRRKKSVQRPKDPGGRLAQTARGFQTPFSSASQDKVSVKVDRRGWSRGSGVAWISLAQIQYSDSALAGTIDIA